MGTAAVTAGQIMDRVANLLNDPNKTDYTYLVMLPYLNMAIDELSERMEESQNSPSNMTANVSMEMTAGSNAIYSGDHPTPGDPPIQIPKYPADLVEIQEVLERPYVQPVKLDAPFLPLTRKEFMPTALYPPGERFLYWTWEDQMIKLAPTTTSARQVLLRYIKQGVPYVANENTVITMINSRSYLSYKTAALCALFIGENESRAGVLEAESEKAAERIDAISNKGRQQMVTRHRPFRASWKARGGF